LACSSGVLNAPKIEYLSVQNFSHLGSLRAGAVVGSSDGSLSFEWTSSSHCVAVIGGGVAPGSGRASLATTSA
jgi:hypothetical protein